MSLRRTSVLLLAFGQAASLKLPLHVASRRMVVSRAAALLLPVTVASDVAAAPTLEMGSDGATLEYLGQSVDLSFKGMDDQTDFREAKKRAIEQEKKAIEKQKAIDKANAAKALKEADAKAKKVSDKKPLSFDELLRNSIKQQEDALGMTMSELDVAALEQKLRKLYPDVAPPAPAPPPAPIEAP